eukprot:3205913-Heterocapsa_arctica.AAC.1
MLPGSGVASVGLLVHRTCVHVRARVDARPAPLVVVFLIDDEDTDPLVQLRRDDFAEAHAPVEALVRVLADGADCRFLLDSSDAARL